MANFDFKETFLNPIFKGNPISVLVLGICSSLAVTVQLKGAFVMGLSVIIVTGLSSLICSLLRNTIPNRIRIIVQLVVVAMMVILRPGAQGLRIQRQQDPLRIYRSYHHQLYRDGTYRGFRARQQAARIPCRWSWKRRRICNDPCDRGFLP